MASDTRILIRRALLSGSALTAAALPLLAAGGASAAQVPGDNGDVKIHVVDAPVPEQGNDPHVCAFYLDAFNFDILQQVGWDIVEWAPTGDNKTVALDGTITLADGAGHTAALSLPNGHYKLEWTFDGEHGDAKHKVFWVDCATTPPPTSPSSSPSSEPSSQPSSKPSSEPSSSPSSSAASDPSSEPSSSPSSSPSTTPRTTPTGTSPTTPSSSPSADTSGSLAHTGAGGVLVLGGMAFAVGLGGIGVRRFATVRGRH